MCIFKKNNSSDKDATYWKSKAEEWERMYRRELLSNQAWSNAVLNAALAHKISCDGQRVLYELHNSEMEAIDKILKD